MISLAMNLIAAVSMSVTSSQYNRYLRGVASLAMAHPTLRSIVPARVPLAVRDRVPSLVSFLAQGAMMVVAIPCPAA